MTGIVAKFDGDDIYDFAAARDWAYARLPEMVFTPQQVVDAAAPALTLEGPYDECGIYFLLRRGKICYIGKAKEIKRRIAQHRKDRRPFDAVAAIIGVHWEFIGDLEAAYVQAWDPPWNNAPVYAYTTPAKTLKASLEGMDLALICTLPELVPFSESEIDDLADRL